MSTWNADHIPDQSGRRAVVTGASSGLGRITARELARHGADVVLAVRSVDKGRLVADEIRQAAPGAQVQVSELDLSSLASVRAFASRLLADGPSLNLLVNNAGIMQTPPRRTAEGYELQLGTNHLGHFALSGLLIDALTQGDRPRIVTVSSTEHKGGRLDFADLQLERGYRPRKAYQQSKLANTVFALELDRRLRNTGSPVLSVLAHPGYSDTSLQSTGPTGLAARVLAVGNRFVAMDAQRGALPQLYAATAPDAQGGRFYGPDGWQEMRGDVTAVQPSPAAQDPETGRRLWSVSEELTGVTFTIPAPAA